jgi:hypothetical protein
MIRYSKRPDQGTKLVKTADEEEKQQKDIQSDPKGLDPSGDDENGTD